MLEDKKRAEFLDVTLDLSQHGEGSGGSQSCSATAVSVSPFGCQLSSNAAGAVPGTSAVAIKPLVANGAFIFVAYSVWGLIWF